MLEYKVFRDFYCTNMLLHLEFLSGDNDDDGDNMEDDDEDDDGDGLANAGEFSLLGLPPSYWNVGMLLA